ncbi:MAG: Gfo/Idh/MocA family oxidoreductase [Planctomycetes bacterium]|nr:Gfo/Idh/MocA family oxidoreductase [Planctomycetota bacterium]
MSATVHIGFIGCGGNARGHMNTLLKLEKAKIVAVCDVVEESARKAAELTGAQPYTSFEKMLERDDLQAAYLSLPVFAHGEPELAVVGRGLPFFVEKPVARDMATARKVLSGVKKKRLITCVGYQLRYGGGTAAARELLAGQNLALVVGQYWSGSGRGNPAAWQLQYAKSGGQILEQATHTLDMMRHLCGEVTDVVTRRASRELKSIDCPDVNAVALTFADGAVGTLTTTWAYDPRDWSHANVLHITYADKLMRWTSEAATVSGGGQPATQHTRPGRSIDEVFIDAVLSGDGSAILSPYEDAVKSLALCLAINKSGESGGRPVKL